MLICAMPFLSAKEKLVFVFLLNANAIKFVEYVVNNFCV